MISTVQSSDWLAYFLYYIYVYLLAPAAILVALLSLYFYRKSKRHPLDPTLSVKDLAAYAAHLNTRLSRVESIVNRSTSATEYRLAGASHAAPLAEVPENKPSDEFSDVDNPDVVGGRADAPQERPVEEFCRLYNQGVDDPQKRVLFHQRYRITRVSTANATLRRRDPNLIPDFQTASGGEFFCTAMRDGRTHAVVPCFDLIYRDLTHDAGAMSFVFETPGYDPRLSYHRVKVRRPALFDLGAGQTWTRKERGILDLGRGESL